MKLERRNVIAILAVLAILSLILAFLLVKYFRLKSTQSSNSTPSTVATPKPIPPSTAALPEGATDPGNENTFTTSGGYIFNADSDGTYTSWKEATNIQAQGELLEWSEDALLLGVQSGQLKIYTPTKLRYLCRPVMVPGINGGAPKKTQDIYSPINEPERVGIIASLADVKRMLPAKQTIYIVATRKNNILEAVLVAGYGCGYPTTSPNEATP